MLPEKSDRHRDVRILMGRGRVSLVGIHFQNHHTSEHQQASAVKWGGERKHTFISSPPALKTPLTANTTLKEYHTEEPHLGVNTSFRHLPVPDWMSFLLRNPHLSNESLCYFSSSLLER